MTWPDCMPLYHPTPEDGPSCARRGNARCVRDSDDEPTIPTGKVPPLPDDEQPTLPAIPLVKTVTDAC